MGGNGRGTMGIVGNGELRELGVITVRGKYGNGLWGVELGAITVMGKLGGGLGELWVIMVVVVGIGVITVMGELGWNWGNYGNEEVGDCGNWE